MYALFLALCLCLLASANAHALPRQHDLSCTEEDVDDFESGTKSHLFVALNEEGNAEEILLKREATDDAPASQLDFNVANSAFTHEIRDAHPDGIDEETKAPIFPFGIDRVEVIEAIRNDGERLRLTLNDHRYSGHPGSSLETGKGERLTRSPYSVGCEGKMRPTR